MKTARERLACSPRGTRNVRTAETTASRTSAAPTTTSATSSAITDASLSAERVSLLLDVALQRVQALVPLPAHLDHPSHRGVERSGRRSIQTAAAVVGGLDETGR